MTLDISTIACTDIRIFDLDYDGFITDLEVDFDGDGYIDSNLIPNSWNWARFSRVQNILYNANLITNRYELDNTDNSHTEVNLLGDDDRSAIQIRFTHMPTSTAFIKEDNSIRNCYMLGVAINNAEILSFLTYYNYPVVMSEGVAELRPGAYGREQASEFIREVFPECRPSTPLTSPQIQLLGMLKASNIYALCNPDVHLYPAVEPEEDRQIFQQIDLTLTDGFYNSANFSIIEQRQNLIFQRFANLFDITSANEIPLILGFNDDLQDDAFELEYSPTLSTILFYSGLERFCAYPEQSCNINWESLYLEFGPGHPAIEQFALIYDSNPDEIAESCFTGYENQVRFDPYLQAQAENHLQIDSEITMDDVFSLFETRRKLYQNMPEIRNNEIPQRAIDDVIFTSPTSAYAWKFRGFIYHTQGDFDEAIRSYDIALDINESYNEVRALRELAIQHEAIND